jgi:hypothetical protein
MSPPVFFAIKNNPDEVSCLKSFTKDNTTYIWELEPHHHEHETLDKVGKKIKLFFAEIFATKKLQVIDLTAPVQPPKQ